MPEAVLVVLVRMNYVTTPSHGMNMFSLSFLHLYVTYSDKGVILA